MLRGLSGFLWGAVVSVLALGALSVADRPVTLPEAAALPAETVTPRDMTPGPEPTDDAEAPGTDGGQQEVPVIAEAEEPDQGPERPSAPAATQTESAPGEAPSGDTTQDLRPDPIIIVEEARETSEERLPDLEAGREAGAALPPEDATQERDESMASEDASGEDGGGAAAEETAPAEDSTDAAPAEADTAKAPPAPARRPEVSVPPVVSTETPAMAPPGEETESPLTDAETDPAARPETGETDLAMASPGEGAEAGGIEVSGDSPVEAGETAAAPAAPDTEEDLSISTEPAQPRAPGVAPEEESAFPAESDAPVAEGNSNTVPEAEAPETAEAAAPDDRSAAQGGTAGTVGDLAEGVTTNRLPRIGAGEGGSGAADPGPVTGEVQDAEGESLPPLRAYAEPVEVAPGKPRMSIVLIDDGRMSIGVEALDAFPYPLTFAVDATAPDAAKRIATYRERGFEVVAMVGLPEGATPSDAEVTLEEVLRREPPVVALMETPENGFSQGRDLSEQVSTILAQSGYGLVLFPKGLNTAQSLAEKAGVPAATVFRDFDAKDETPTVIRRFLDQAAFRAGQEESVIMVGRLRPDTISALLLWGLQDRASSVALVPVSQVLRPDS